jgi:hypothetical protein
LASTRPWQGADWCWLCFASSVVGLIASSIPFLWLAFGSLEFLAGQIIGNAWMVLLALPFVHWIRRRETASDIAD